MHVFRPQDILTPQLTARLANIRAFLLDVDGVLTDGAIHQTERGLQTKVINMMDRDSIRAAQEAGIHFGIISAGGAELVRTRAQELSISDVYLNAFDKREPYEEFKLIHDLKDEEVAYMGDEIFDVSLLRTVGFAATPSNGHSSAKVAAHYVASRRGGYGAVREVLQMLLYVKELNKG